MDSRQPDHEPPPLKQLDPAGGGAAAGPGSSGCLPWDPWPPSFRAAAGPPGRIQALDQVARIGEARSGVQHSEDEAVDRGRVPAPWMKLFALMTKFFISANLRNTQVSWKMTCIH